MRAFSLLFLFFSCQSTRYVEISPIIVEIPTIPQKLQAINGFTTEGDKSIIVSNILILQAYIENLKDTINYYIKFYKKDKKK